MLFSKILLEASSNLSGETLSHISYQYPVTAGPYETKMAHRVVMRTPRSQNRLSWKSRSATGIVGIMIVVSAIWFSCWEDERGH